MHTHTYRTSLLSWLPEPTAAAALRILGQRPRCYCNHMLCVYIYIYIHTCIYTRTHTYYVSCNCIT